MLRAAAPLPVRDCWADGLEALLANDALAEAVPLDWGAKVTVNDTLLPAARVSGREIPLTVNSEVLMLAFDTVMLEPLAVSEAVRLLLCPTVTLPKFSVAGLTANWPETVAVPAREMVSVGLEASETTEIDPVALPPVVGAEDRAEGEALSRSSESEAGSSRWHGSRYRRHWPG